MAGERILVVDDNPANLRLLRLLLSGESYEVRTADGAEEAITILEDFRPRLILMDLQMPGMNGFELARRKPIDTRTLPALVARHLSGAEPQRPM